MNNQKKTGIAIVVMAFLVAAYMQQLRLKHWLVRDRMKIAQDQVPIAAGQKPLFSARTSHRLAKATAKATGM